MGVADEIRQAAREPLLQLRGHAVVERGADVVAIEAHGRVTRVRLEQLCPRDRRIAERRGSRNLAEERIGHRLLQRRTDGELLDRQLIQVRVRDAHVRDLRADVPDLDAHRRGQLALNRGIPLLGVARAKRPVHGEDALTEASRRVRRDRRDARTVLQHERRRDVAQRALRDGLQERERRRRERRGDAGHLDPDQAVAGADERLVGQPIRDAETWAEVVFLQRPHRFVTRVFEQLRLAD